MEQPYRSYYTAMMPFPGRAVLPIDLAGLSGTAGGGGGASPMRAHLQVTPSRRPSAHPLPARPQHRRPPRLHHQLRQPTRRVPATALMQPDMAGVCATITTDGGQVLHSDGTEWGVLPTPQCGFHELMLAHLNDSPELSPPLEEDTGFMLDLLRSSSLTELTTLGTSTLPPAPQPGQVQVSQAHALCSLQQLPLPLSSNILPPPEPEAEAETQAKAEPQTKADVQAATDGVAAMEIGDKGEAEAAQQEAKPQEGHAR